MTIRLTLFAALFGLSVFQPALSAGDKPSKFFQWEGVGLEYPASWKLAEGNAPNEQSRTLHLNSGTNPTVTIVLSLSKDKNLAGAEQSQAGGVGEAFCLPMALNLAEKDEGRIAHIPTRIEVSGRSIPSVLMTVDQKAGEANAFRSMHCFAVYDGKRVAVGAVLSGGLRGKIMSQEPFREAINQAYAVLNTIKLR